MPIPWPLYVSDSSLAVLLLIALQLALLYIAVPNHLAMYDQIHTLLRSLLCAAYSALWHMGSVPGAEMCHLWAWRHNWVLLHSQCVRSHGNACTEAVRLGACVQRWAVPTQLQQHVLQVSLFYVLHACNAMHLNIEMSQGGKVRSLNGCRHICRRHFRQSPSLLPRRRWALPALDEIFMRPSAEEAWHPCQHGAHGFSS